MRYQKLLLILLTFVFLLTGMLWSKTLEVDAKYNFQDALNFAFSDQGRIDTLLLITSGGIYTNHYTPAKEDTFFFQIMKPIVIMAKPGLEEKPIFRHSDQDSSVNEIFRIHDDVTFEGVVFDGYNAVRPPSNALRVGHIDDEVQVRTWAREGLNVTLRNCEFQNFLPNNWENASGGHAINYMRRPDDFPLDPPVKGGNLIIEDCIFKNMGDEAIRISETNKDPRLERPLDTLIVRNCTFNNVASECIRYYADDDTTNNTDAYVLVEHLTIDSCGIEAIYLRRSKHAMVRDIIVSNNQWPKPYRGSRTRYTINVQNTGATITNIDTFNLIIGPNSTAEPLHTSYDAIDVDTNLVWGLDPMYEDPANFNYALLPSSQMYGKAHDKSALGDLNWADPTVGINDDISQNIPDAFELHQNYPNPFNPTTSIAYTLPHAGLVTLTIYDITGRLVETLVNTDQPAGRYDVTWHSANNASGIYFYKLNFDNQSNVKKMMLIR